MSRPMKIAVLVGLGVAASYMAVFTWLTFRSVYEGNWEDPHAEDSDVEA